MAQKVSKHGTTYTTGSQRKHADWHPRNCSVCGERVTLKAGFWGRLPVPYALHHHCTKAWYESRP